MKKRPQFGKLPPKYHFSLNPYPEFRFSSCPDCKTNTGQRTLPLMVHIDPKQMIALNYTSRYCKHCDTLIAHKHEIENLLTKLFQQLNPEHIGNNYLIFGTIEKKAWRENMKKPKFPNEIVQHISDFKSYETIQMRMGGWFQKDQVQPIMQAPPSTTWVKGKKNSQ
ncbi:hypothetical protein MHK_010296 [Candidatus Magnetomorum sp. HK-1]|nr:hypothetical protein MHK_010296 [Candidatus Magnetomorum sp. HK-1]